jgi:hypothetical protein
LLIAKIALTFFFYPVSFFLFSSFSVISCQLLITGCWVLVCSRFQVSGFKCRRFALCTWRFALCDQSSIVNPFYLFSCIFFLYVAGCWMLDAGFRRKGTFHVDETKSSGTCYFPIIYLSSFFFSSRFSLALPAPTGIFIRAKMELFLVPGISLNTSRKP